MPRRPDPGPPAGGGGAQRFEGRVCAGFQFASGQAVGREVLPSPFSDATLRLQHPHFLAQGIDLPALVPGLFWGTINIALRDEWVLVDADHRVILDWTAGERCDAARVGPELFLLLRCRIFHRAGDYPGLVYYPHPSTKPPTNGHRHDVIEVLAPPVPGLVVGDAIHLHCRSGAFVPR